MGRGRGKLSKWFAPMHTGKLLFEIPKKFTAKRIQKVYKKIATRLPVDSKLILKAQKKSRFFISANSPQTIKQYHL
jgi:ribosomal protein L16/L10AE